MERLFSSSGRLDGVQLRNFANGKRSQEEPYVMGKLQGVSKTWNDKGQLRSEATYEKDMLTARKTWDEHGTLTEDDTFFPDGSRKSKIKKP